MTRLTENNLSTAATIAAVSTPAGISGIAVIRVSGSRAGFICDQLFRPLNQHFQKPSRMKPYTVGVGYWYSFDPLSPKQEQQPDFEHREMLDKVVLTFYKAPHSYTGEDVYEISCHGGPYIKQSILQSLFDAGAVAAGPGEFSRRAFINGKLDLAEAEAVMDMIAAESNRQNQVALRQLRGQLSKQISELRGDLYQVLAQIEMIIEFPEHEDTEAKRTGLIKQVQSIVRILEAAIAGFEQGKIIREGFHVVIAGRPNVGKSSLLNALLGEEKAIVTEIPGTTRDMIEAHLIIHGLSVHLTDTAGLRVTSDIVEKEGIDRARQAIDRSDLILYMFSPDSPANWQEDLREIELLNNKGKQVAVISGKQDLPNAEQLNEFLAENLPEMSRIEFSKFQSQNAAGVKDYILKVFESLGSSESDAILITHLRHRQILEKTCQYCREALQAIDDRIPLDLVSGLLLAAAEALAEITGDQVSEELIETIFSQFCVGK